MMINRRNFIKKSSLAAATAMTLGPVSMTFKGCARANGDRAAAMNLTHTVAAAREGRFLGWPANNGLWSWENGREILVGFSEGDFEPQEGHNVGHDLIKNHARSLDGGRTWTVEEPENFVGARLKPEPSPGGIDFTHPGFAMRVAAMGYRASDERYGCFHISNDKGKTWTSPYRFNGLEDEPEIQGLKITARTNYLVRDRSTCLIMMSARDSSLEFGTRLDKSFVAITDDGGNTFRFLSWIVPWTDNYRAVMPSVVETPSGNFIAALRRRNPRNDELPCWIDAYISEDEGRSWNFLSRVAETGLFNGNPPALALLRDGRLACCYANRSTAQMLVSYSSDEGGSWGNETVIRENPMDHDIGYPQLIQNDEGKLVAMYYLADERHPEAFIEAALWRP